MAQPHYAVSVVDLEDGPLTREWELPVAWLDAALDESEARARRPGAAEVELTLSGSEVLVRGRVRVPLSMPCVVTLEPVDVDVDADLLLLLVPASPPEPRRAQNPERKGGGQRRGSAHSTHGPAKDGSWADDPELSSTDAGHDTYDGEVVALDDFLREAILLELPMSPRRSDLISGTAGASVTGPAESRAAVQPSLDPRLAPLAEIAERLRKEKE